MMTIKIQFSEKHSYYNDSLKGSIILFSIYPDDRILTQIRITFFWSTTPIFVEVGRPELRMQILVILGCTKVMTGCL